MTGLVLGRAADPKTEPSAPRQEIKTPMTTFITKDSGERATFDSGMQRDTEAGKPRFDLLIPEAVPYRQQFITRLAELMGRGAEKYEDRNWEQADSTAELKRMKSSAFRHFMQWLCGETDEDHAAATVFNLLAFETTKLKVEAQGEPASVAQLYAVMTSEPAYDVVDEREALVEFATWLSDEVELDVDTPDHAVDRWLSERVA